MSTHQNYSKEFKEAIITKVLNRGPESIGDVCLREGVKHSTVGNWMRTCAKVGAQTPKKRGRMKWTAEAKLKAVVETSGLSEIDFGKYLRREGLYSTQVAEWRADIVSHLSFKPKFQKDDRDSKINLLEREILRKDKALAEASALLILQKKVDLIWGSKSEDVK